MKPTLTLPESHLHCYTLESGQHKIAQGILVVIGLGILFLLSQTIKFMPVDLAQALKIKNTPIDRAVGAGTILIAIGIVVILHEGVHGLVLWFFTREWPSFGLNIFHAYVDASRWYLPRWTAIAMSMAPVCLLSIVGVLLLSVASTAIFRMIFWAMLFNVVGSVNDLAVAIWVYLQPVSVLVKNNGKALSIYRASDERAKEFVVKKRLRVLLEQSLARLL